jgi:hypothetical protein
LSIIEQELGTGVPAQVQIRVVEKTPDTTYLVLPPSASPLGQGGELSDRDLEAVAGGDPRDVQTYTDGFDRNCCP